MIKNKLLSDLKISFPVIQAPMAGSSPSKLVAAVSNAGALGSLGAAAMNPEQLRAAIKEVRALTNKSFAVNLFVPENIAIPTQTEIIRANKALDIFRHELGIPASPEFKPVQLSFEDQLEVLIEEQVKIFSFTFGILSLEIVEKLKHHSVLVIGTATTVREAKLLVESGVDAIVAQGSEAGGHRGSAPDTKVEDALIGSMALIPQIVDVVKVPVIAAGGIMDGRGIVAALSLGALAVQMGTAFLGCPESGIHTKHREALLNSDDESTNLTRAYTGRYARGIKNKFITAMKNYNDVLPYPLQRSLTRDVTLAAAQQNNSELMIMWSGQAASLSRTKPASVLVEELMKEVEEIIRNFSQLTDNGTVEI